MLNVAITVDSPTNYGARSASVVSAACEEVIGQDRCPLASELPPGTVVAWYAVVHPFDRDLTSVRVEFHDRSADGVLIEERVLVFPAADDQHSRYASIGSVVAAMAAAREGSLTQAPRVRPPPPPPPQAPPPPPPAVEPEPLDLGLGIGALLVPSLRDEPYRVGGLFDARLGWSPRYFALVGARYAAHGGDPSFSWWTLSAGIGTRIGERRGGVHLELSGEAVFERTAVSAERGSDSESVTQTGWGGRLAAVAVWSEWRHFGLTLGVDGNLVLPRINVVVAEERVVSVPSTSLGLSVGVRFQP